MNNYTIGIVGYGHVGRAMHKLFDEWVKAIYDPFVEIPDGVGKSQVLVNACDLAIVCVMTKENGDGSCDLSIVEETIKWLQAPVILIKSAVVPGTADHLKQLTGKRIVVSPEYFGEWKYFMPEEWREPRAWPFQIFGGDPKDTAYCVEVFKPLFSPRTTYMQVDAKTAELTKYMENIWGAMKVTWANEFYEIAQAMGIDFNVLRECWALDPRVDKMHTAVYPKDRGFGGKCFPKDLRALINASRKAGYEPELLVEIDKSNQRFRKKN